MISIWPFFEPGSANYDFMDKNGWFIDKFKFAKPPYHTDGMAVYDATNAGSAQILLGPGQQGTLQHRRGCLVDGYDRAGNRRPGRKHSAWPQAGNRAAATAM